MAKRGHRPQRTCLGCGGRDDQDQLIRLAVTGQDQLSVEPRRGRGGYLHRNQKCQQAFNGRKGLYRAFHVEVSRTAKTRLVEDLASRNRE
ncbi:MAG: YlxR family protein, partial [Deltaproteobacteria bacterium]|nr:YlxR family protein [Deltaproteobacteria bacterium]